MLHKIRRDNIGIVLQQPLYPENIGATARAMQNMGFKRLMVVNPADFNPSRIRMMATPGAAEVVEAITIHSSLKEVLGAFNYVVGTTARLGGQRQVISTPERLTEKILTVSHNNQVAIVFGPEDRGLTNEDLRLCHHLVTIPTAEFASFNLAQAVLLICYELFKYGREKVPEFTPRLANRFELDGMYTQLKDILVRISYINTENPDYWIGKMRHFFTRMQLRAKEVAIIRGICRQINWYGKKCYQDGWQAGRKNQAAVELPPEEREKF